MLDETCKRNLSQVVTEVTNYCNRTNILKRNKANQYEFLAGVAQYYGTNTRLQEMEI